MQKGSLPQTIRFFSNKYQGDSPDTSLRSNIKENTWYHVVWSYNGSTFTGYLNGVVDVSKMLHLP